jgi:hypothetical protein
MKIDELKTKGFIDLADDIRFKTHADVMRLFGIDGKVMQRSFYKHAHEDGVHIWFPIIHPLEANGWENKWGMTEDTLFERKLDGYEAYIAELLANPDRHRRVLFAKIAPFGEVFYKFKGTYELDRELAESKGKARYIRTGERASIYPA